MAVKSDPVKLVKSLLAESDSPQYLLIASSDEVRRKRIVQLFLDRFQRADGKKPGELVKIDGGSLQGDKLSAFKNELMSVSLFTPIRYFVVSKLDDIDSKSVKEFVDCIQDLPPEVRVIVVLESAPTVSPLRKFFAKAGAIIALEDLKGLELRRWIHKELKQQGVSAWSEDVLEQIAILGDEDPDLIVPIIEQLNLFLESGESLTPQKIQQMYGNHKDPSEFILMDLLSRGQRWKVELTISQLFQNGKNAFALLALLAKSFSRQLVIAWMLEKGVKHAEIRQRLGLAPWLFQKHLDTAQRYSANRLKECLFATLAADARLKDHSLGQEAIFSELAGRLSP